MTIRDATTEDVEEIQRVARSSWNEDYPEILSRDSIREGLEEWYSRDRLRDAIVWSRAFVVLGERDGEVAGFAHAIWDDDERVGHVLRVYVAPDHRGAGLGRDLLEATRDRLVDMDVERIEAMVLEENEPGNEFYRAFGFEHDSTTDVSVGEERHAERTYVLEPAATTDG